MYYPLEMQKEILEGYKAQNEESHKKHLEFVKAGHYMTMEGHITGPYTTHITRFYSNGESLSFVEPSSLEWAFNTREFL